MNNIKFDGRANFPLSIETMTFLQDIIKESAQLCKLGGANYILSGCEENGLTVNAGYMVLNGELIKFEGGQKQEFIYIYETKRSVVAAGYNFPDVYTSRVARFGYATDRFKWDELKRVQTNLELSEAIKNINITVESLRGMPKGLICMWSGNVGELPAGWALCDGIGGRPNLAGRFVVGYNQHDSDYNSIGRTGGYKEITLSLTQIPAHSHALKFKTYKWGDNANHRPFPDNYGTDSYAANTQSAGGSRPHENRPPYYVLAYIIKL